MPKLMDKHANVKTDLDAILSGKRVIEGTRTKVRRAPKELVETINSESELLSKLVPLSEADIYSFMSNLHNGTYFNMGIFKSVAPAKAYKQTYRIYRVVNSSSIVTGAGYENIGTTKEYRDATGAIPMPSWYDHEPGYENKIGALKKDPSQKYVMWTIKKSSDSWVAFYLVDISTGSIIPISREDLKYSDYITKSEKRDLGLLGDDEEIQGWDPATNKFIIVKNPNYVPKATNNETKWRTTKFANIFWLKQSSQEYGAKFEESLTSRGAADLEEDVAGNTFRDLHAHVHTDIDAILSGSTNESLKEDIIDDLTVALTTPGTWGVEFVGEDCICFDSEADAREYFESLSADDIYADSEGIELFKVIDSEGNTETVDCISIYDESLKAKGLKESYRRTVSRGASLNDNELFVDFD